MGKSDFDMDAIYKAAREQHAVTKERKKNSGKWGFIYRSFGPKVYLRILPLPGSVGGFYEPVLLHRIGGQGVKDSRFELCREYFQKKCKNCEKKDAGDKSIQNQRKALALCLVKDDSVRPALDWEPKLVQAPISIFEQINAALSDEEGEDGAGGFEFKDYINLKAKAKVFKVTKTGEKLETKYAALPCSKVMDFDVEKVKAALGKMKEWKQIVIDLFVPKATTTTAADNEDPDEADDLSELDTPATTEKKPTSKKPKPAAAAVEDVDDLATGGDEDDLTSADPDADDTPAPAAAAKPKPKPTATKPKPGAAKPKPAPAAAAEDPDDVGDPDADLGTADVDDADLDNIEVDLDGE